MVETAWRRRAPALLCVAALLGLAPADAPAQADLCADPQTSCAAVVPQRCLAALGAGSIRANPAEGGRADCQPFLNQYRKCLETVALTCSAPGGQSAGAAPAAPAPGGDPPPAPHLAPALNPAPATAPSDNAQITQRLFGQWRCESAGQSAAGRQSARGVVTYGSSEKVTLLGEITETAPNGTTITVGFRANGRWRVVNGQIESEILQVWSQSAILNGQNVFHSMKGQIDQFLNQIVGGVTIDRIETLTPDRLVTRNALNVASTCTR